MKIFIPTRAFSPSVVSPAPPARMDIASIRLHIDRDSLPGVIRGSTDTARPRTDTTALHAGLPSTPPCRPLSFAFRQSWPLHLRYPYTADHCDRHSREAEGGILCTHPTLLSPQRWQQDAAANP